MGKAGTVSQARLDRARDEYLKMQAEISLIRRSVEERFRPKIEDEIEYETRALQRAFGAVLAELKDDGATYAERVKIIGTAKADVMRRYIELGGGNTKRVSTAEERAANAILEAAEAEEVAHKKFTDALAKAGVELVSWPDVLVVDFFGSDIEPIPARVVRSFRGHVYAKVAPEMQAVYNGDTSPENGMHNDMNMRSRMQVLSPWVTEQDTV